MFEVLRLEPLCLITDLSLNIVFRSLCIPSSWLKVTAIQRHPTQKQCRQGMCYVSSLYSNKLVNFVLQILRKYCFVSSIRLQLTGLNWLKIGPNGRLLWTQKWNFGFLNSTEFLDQLIYYKVSKKIPASLSCSGRFVFGDWIPETN